MIRPLHHDNYETTTAAQVKQNWKNWILLDQNDKCVNRNDLISVIVPVYNMEQYMERCVNSIINQTYHNLEIILVDDGSTDHSPAMCDEYALRDGRIKVVHKPNGGLSDARNAGLAVVSGNYDRLC